MPSSQIEILQLLATAGADIGETDEFGKNCLFLCACNAVSPNYHTEFKALSFLLTVFDDIYAQDRSGKTVFDALLDLGFDDSHSALGSYRYDLWYCALYRSGLARRFDIPQPNSKTVFGAAYTVEHYRSLLYLDYWDLLTYFNLQNHHLASHFPSSAEEREQAPAFAQWGLTDLIMMERRALPCPT